MVEPRRHLDPAHDRFDQLPAGRIDLLRDGQRRADVADAGMTADEVVQLQGVTEIAVYPDRRLDRSPFGRPDDDVIAALLTRRRVAALRRQYQAGLGGPRSCDDAPQGVQDAKRRLLPDRRGNPVPRQAFEPPGQAAERDRPAPGRNGSANPPP